MKEAMKFYTVKTVYINKSFKVYSNKIFKNTDTDLSSLNQTSQS